MRCSSTYTPFGVTHTSTGATNLPGTGFPTWTRSAVTSSPLAKLNDTHGLGIRPNVIFWIGWPVVEFMIVAVMLIRRSLTAKLRAGPRVKYAFPPLERGVGSRRQSRHSRRFAQARKPAVHSRGELWRGLGRLPNGRSWPQTCRYRHSTVPILTDIGTTISVRP